MEVRRFDDERIAFPMTPRVAHVQMDVPADVSVIVERNHTGLVNHLVANRDVALALHDLIGVAVNRRHHRSRQAPREAAIVQAAILPRVCRPVSEPASGVGAHGDAPFRFGCHRRHFAVWRVDDEPSLVTPL